MKQTKNKNTTGFKWIRLSIREQTDKTQQADQLNNKQNKEGKKIQTARSLPTHPNQYWMHPELF